MLTNEEVLEAHDAARSEACYGFHPYDHEEVAKAAADARAAVLARMAPDWIAIGDDAPRDRPLLGISLEDEQAVIRWDPFWSAWYSNGMRFFPTHYAELRPGIASRPAPGSDADA